HLITGATQVRDDGSLYVTRVDPGEGLGLLVGRPQRRAGAIQRPEILQVAEESRAHRLIGRLPGKAHVMAPLRRLSELGAHEEQLATRLGVLVGDEAAQVREAAPLVTGHLAEQGSLA